jgi:demethylmenaquinone methyltransferase/2-methoxy-6-polyprenyl-1,4-benzoquinol methylase
MIHKALTTWHLPLPNPMTRPPHCGANALSHAVHGLSSVYIINKMKADLVDYYAKRAKEYELIYDKPERQADLLELKKVLKAAFSNEEIIEIACGTGYWTQAIAETATSVLATDINQEVIEVAKTKKYPKNNVSFAIADSYTLADIQPTFTGGFGGFIWSHIPLEKLPQFLDTLHSKVKTGGKVVFIDNTYVEGNSTPISQTDSSGNTYQRRMLKDGTGYLVLKNFPTQAQIRLLLKGKAVTIEFKQLEYFWYLIYHKQ